MNLIFWKKNKMIDVFAGDLASHLFSAIQPDAMREYFARQSADKKARKANKKAADLLEDLIQQVRQFKAMHSLGVYGKARLHMKFTKRLEELGYDSIVAQKVNEEIMLKTP